MTYPTVISLAALVFGLSAGAFTAWNELRSDDPALVSSSGKPDPVAPRPSERVPQARVLIEGEQTDFNFGTMQRGETQKHVWVFRNVGDAPLTVTKGKVSCVCTMSNLEASSVPPGGKTDVTLEWTPKAYAPDFRQTAEIFTNDPERKMVTLSISGRVTQAVRPIPEDLTLSRVTVSEPQTYSFKVYSFLAGNFELTKMEVQPEQTAAHFALAEEPLSAEELAAEPGAKAGRKVTVTLKPGMPVGPLHSTVRLETNQKDVLPIEIPIKGTVVSDISLAPRNDLDLEENIFKWGTISGAQGKSVTLHVTVRGKHRDDVKIKVGEVDPPELQVTVGEPKGSGEVRIYPVTLTIPPGTPSITRLGGTATPFGKIVLETTHPTAPQLVLHVRFAVE